jgi:two-component system, chemotaxis family, CheB/CheR fusion protein
VSQDVVDDDFEALLEYLPDARAFDFTGYKRSTLMRRVTKRMEAVGVPSYAEYLDHLQVHPEEFTDLFNFILINVTSFFRDLLGLREEEVLGKPLLSLETGLPGDDLAAPLDACLSGSQRVVELEATTLRGKRVRRVSCSPVLSRDREVSGAILLLEEA